MTPIEVLSTMEPGVQVVAPSTRAFDELHRLSAESGFRYQLADGLPQRLPQENRPRGMLLKNLTDIVRAAPGWAAKGLDAVAEPGIIPTLSSETNFRVAAMAVTSPVDGHRHGGRLFRPSYALLPGENTIQRPQPGYEESDGSPIAIIEVTSAADISVVQNNVWAYATISSIAEIVVIRCDSVSVVYHCREGQGWTTRTIDVSDRSASFPIAGIQVNLEELYRSLVSCRL